MPKTFRIMYQNAYHPEEIDSADTATGAAYLVSEYRQAFARGHVWIEKVSEVIG